MKSTPNKEPKVTTEIISEIETTEDWIENTAYGELPVRSRKREQVVRWTKRGNLELRVDYWRNGIKLPGYSDGNPQRIAEALERASA